MGAFRLSQATAKDCWRRGLGAGENLILGAFDYPACETSNRKMQVGPDELEGPADRWGPSAPGEPMTHRESLGAGAGS